MDWLDTYSDPSVKAASVVTNLWIAAFALCSAVFALLGVIVALQWPHPRVLCYKTRYSDMPSSSLRSCCSLYSLNLGFTVFWLLVFAIMVIARDVVRIVVCLCFFVVHVVVVVLFRMKFKRHGRPERPYNPAAEMAVASSFAPPASLAPGQAMGIPIYNIPMQTVVIGSSAAARTGEAGAGAADTGPGAQQGYLYSSDADCVHPPAQQHMQQHYGGAAAGGAAAAAAAAAYAYPPQTAAAAAAVGPQDGGGFHHVALGQPVAGVPAAFSSTQPVVAPAAAGAAGAPPRASMDAAGAAAGAAAAAGAGTAVSRTQQQ